MEVGQMRYIYCFENKINKHKYVGQTNNLRVRYSAHKSQSYNPNSKDYNCLFHKKIREYGLENFDFYVLEEIESEDSDFIDFREQFWIEQLETWCRYGKGYNELSGGKQFKKNISISDKEISLIKERIRNSEASFSDIAKEFNTYRDCISRINIGRYGYDENEDYPIRVTRDWREVPQEIKTEIAFTILNTKLFFKDIAAKYQVSEHLVSQINNGQSNLEGDYIYPLRKSNQHLSQEQEEIILKGLQEKEKIKDIAEKAKVSRSTVSKRKKKYNL